MPTGLLLLTMRKLLVTEEPSPPAICRDCGIGKEPEHFLDKYHVTKLGFTVYYPNCNDCRDAEARQRVKVWRKKNPKRKYKHKYDPLKCAEATYGITPHDYTLMLERQGHRCVICRDEFESTKTRHIDHCHETGVVRGILCSRCNHGLGFFRDNIDNLLRAVSYLSKTKLTQEEF